MGRSAHGSWVRQPARLQVLLKGGGSTAFERVSWFWLGCLLEKQRIVVDTSGKGGARVHRHEQPTG